MHSLLKKYKKARLSGHPGLIFVFLVIAWTTTLPLSHAQTNGMTRYKSGLLQFFGNGTWSSVDFGWTGLSCTLGGGLTVNFWSTMARPGKSREWRPYIAGN